jgi:hypothetical protein
VVIQAIPTIAKMPTIKYLNGLSRNSNRLKTPRINQNTAHKMFTTSSPISIGRQTISSKKHNKPMKSPRLFKHWGE